jgi:nickel transport protein
VWGESEHGFHGTDVSVEVGEGLMLKGFKKPLVATHLKIFIGLSLIFGLFGLVTLWRGWRARKGA